MADWCPICGEQEWECVCEGFKRMRQLDKQQVTKEWQAGYKAGTEAAAQVAAHKKVARRRLLDSEGAHPDAICKAMMASEIEDAIRDLLVPGEPEEADE